MRRERIDAAVHAQIDRMIYLLRDVVRSGGKDRWSHLYSHGHHYPTVLKAVRDGNLIFCGNSYAITEQGERYLADIDQAAVRAQPEKR